MRAGVPDLGYAHFRSSAVDHIVSGVAFGGTISLWCEWQGSGVEFAKEPRVRGRVCLDCVDKKRTAQAQHLRELNDRPRKHASCGLEHRPSEVCPVTF